MAASSVSSRRSAATRAWTVALALAPLVLTACSAVDRVAERRGSATRSPSPAASSADVAAEAREAKSDAEAVLRKASTGAYAQKTVTEVPDGQLIQHQRIRYDLSLARFGGRLTYETTSPTFDTGDPPLSELDVVYADGKAYVGRGASGPRRWLVFPTGPNASGPMAGLTPVGAPHAVVAFFAFEATGLGPAGSGRTLTGTIPAAEAVGLLGLNGTLAKSGVDIASLGGSAEARVAVDSKNHVLTFQMEGSSLTTTPPLSEDVAAVIGDMSLTVTFSGIGDPVRIDVPRPDQIATQTPGG